MGLNKRFSRLSKEATAKTDVLADLLPLISQGEIIPVISNSFRIEQIFSEVSEGATGEGGSTITEQLTADWASLIEYPMSDNQNLARVAQYCLEEQKDSPHARTKYLEFLKSLLLAIASDDADYTEVTHRLKTQIQEQQFSEIAHQLEYPRFPEGAEDPLRILAKLPFKIYITTSYYNFIERALEAENKKPHAQVCFWTGEKSNAKAEHVPDQSFEPTPDQPLVYHLYGLEDYRQTLVLSEDDYLNFLIRATGDSNTQNPLIPFRLRHALAESHLMLLGYREQDWDFRILFKLISGYRSEFSPRSLLIQPSLPGTEKNEKWLGYLERYFDRRHFSLEQIDAGSFIKKLWDQWNQYRQGQY